MNPSPEPLFAVIPYRRRTVGEHKKGREYAPRFDLAPMNHREACAWVRNCTTDATGYRLIPWHSPVPR